MKAHKRKQKQNKSSLDHNYNNQIYWIEKLLSTPLADHRKYCIWRILTPYLLNIRKQSEQEIYDNIIKWCRDCGKLRRTDFNVTQRIREGIAGAGAGYLPIALDTLRDENPGLYDLLIEST
jgi:hypothetical protein